MDGRPMSPLLWIICAGLLMAAIALSGSITLLLDRKTLERAVLPLVALAAGTLLGGALFHMLPEALAVATDPVPVFLWLTLGFVAFFALEELLRARHVHSVGEHDEKPLPHLILIGDGLHNFIGGLAVGGAFLADIRVGIMTWIAAAAHEVPQELGDFGVLVHSGWSRRRALFFNFLSGVLFLIGGLVAWSASQAISVDFLLPFAAGNFLYIAAADLVPEIRREQRRGHKLVAAACFIGGLFGLFALKVALPEPTIATPAEPPHPVAARIAAEAGAANIGHRGVGKTSVGRCCPENALSSFAEAEKQGADGIELDVQLTSDDRVIVMHDDDLARTTTCTGCVTANTLAEVASCRLLDGDGAPLDEGPPTLDQVFALVPPEFLVNVELKVADEGCAVENGARRLARAAVAEIHGLGVSDRAFFSSFSTEAALAVEELEPRLYSALLLNRRDSTNWREGLALARDAGLDAIHPHHGIPASGVSAIRAAGLQVNVWTVNTPVGMRTALESGVSAIITDEPGVLEGVLAERRSTARDGQNR